MSEIELISNIIFRKEEMIRPAGKEGRKMKKKWSQNS
jgi:hypothetical protein